MLRQCAIATLLSLPLALGAAPHQAHKPACRADLASCPDTGCGTDFDARLNERKNIRSEDSTVFDKTLEYFMGLPDPKHFVKGGSRDELRQLGEGQQVRVVAYLIAAKQEGAESCNCGLTDPAWTDNHLVLVAESSITKYHLGGSKSDKEVFHSRETESMTAEFTPRVRIDHPHFTKATMDPSINAAPQKALLVRVTGLQLFDSEHFLEHPVVCVNNWEIHPVLKMEYCTTGSTCTLADDAGWQSID